MRHRKFTAYDPAKWDYSNPVLTHVDDNETAGAMLAQRLRGVGLDDRRGFGRPAVGV